MKAKQIIQLCKTHDLFNKHIPNENGICKTCFMPLDKDKFVISWTSRRKYHYISFLQDLYKKDPDLMFEVLIALIKIDTEVDIGYFMKQMYSPSQDKRVVNLEKALLEADGRAIYRYVSAVQPMLPLKKFKKRLLEKGTPRMAFYYAMYVQDNPCIDTYRMAQESDSIGKFYRDHFATAHGEEMDKILTQIDEEEKEEAK